MLLQNIIKSLSIKYVDEAELDVVINEDYAVGYSARHGGTPGHVRTLVPQVIKRESFVF